MNALSIFSTAWLAKLFNTEIFVSKTKTKWQLKRLDGNVTAAGIMPSLTFNNLTIGRTYRITLHVNYQGIGQKKVVINNGAVVVGVSEMAAGSSELNLDTVAVFLATATTLTFDKIAANAQIQGGSADNEGTFSLLEELPNHEITTDWT